ncbi:uncharacterized protein K444DRAFT_613924, partial [Hyaloscypha bicolor E]
MSSNWFKGISRILEAIQPTSQLSALEAEVSTLHILSGKTLFDRAILMSGSCPIIGPLPLQLLEKGWKTLFAAAEISAETPEKRLEELRSLFQD